MSAPGEPDPHATPDGRLFPARNVSVVLARTGMARRLSRIAKAFIVIWAVWQSLPMLIDTPVVVIGAVVSGLLCFAAVVLFIVSYILSLTEAWQAGSVRVDEAALEVKGAALRRISRAEITGAVVVQRAVAWSVWTVDVDLRGGDRLTVRFFDRESAAALVDALGFGPSGARVTVPLEQPSRRLLHLPLGIAACLIGFMLDALASAATSTATIPSEVSRAVLSCWPLFALAVYEGIGRFARAPRVTIGDDGVLVEGARRRFVPRREIASVPRESRGARLLERIDGSIVAAPGALLDLARVEAARHLIASRQSATVTPSRVAQYERQGASVAAWRERLRVAMDPSGYRDAAAPPVMEAADVIRSAGATPEQRVGAALALRAAGEPPARIRVAAEGAVDPGVREALEAVAADDDTRVESALRRAR